MSGLECGQEISVKDPFGTRIIRMVSQCGGRFMVISTTLDPRNGYLLPDWRGVMRELVALAVPYGLRLEKGKTAESMTGGIYHNLPLTYPLSVKGLAELVGEDAGEVGELLKDLAVQSE